MMSAPPKMQYKSSDCDGPQLMKDAQKAYASSKDNVGEEVYIPENIKESDSESDSFGERLRKLNEDGQTSKQSGKHDRLCFVQLNDVSPVIAEKNDEYSGMDLIHSDKAKGDLPEKDDHKRMTEYPEIYITDDHIIHTQESQAQNGDVLMEDVVP